MNNEQILDMTGTDASNIITLCDKCGRRDHGSIACVAQDQAWFWTPRWQELERQVDGDLAAGNFSEYANVADFIASLLD